MKRVLSLMVILVCATDAAVLKVKRENERERERERERKRERKTEEA